MRITVLLLTLGSIMMAGDLEKARDAQDRPMLDKLAAQAAADAQKKPDDASVQYKLALSESYIAEVAIELHDKNVAHSAAEAGIKAAERSVTLKPDIAEYHRLWGTLCGQAVSSAGIQGLKYGKCAQDQVNRALQLDPKSAM